MVTDVFLETGEVAIENEAVVAPLGMVIDAGTVATVLEEISEIMTPPVPAFFDRLIFPEAEAPPFTEDGATVKLRIV